MKVSFSTLACPSWSLAAVIEQAHGLGFDGIELRFVSGSDRLWELPEFTGAGLHESLDRFASAGLAIPCVDTSCFFHSTNAAQRAQSIEMGRHMIDLAFALGAPGIRVFGDRVQPGADLSSTTAWIADGIRQLAQFAQPAGVEVWLESHGDFASASETMRVLQLAGEPNTGVLWDPLNAYAEFAEEPAEGWRELGAAVRHVHIKDGTRLQNAPPSKPWDPVFVGDGIFPASALVELLRRHGYQRFISLEWEKRWHPEIPAPEIALPRFMAWFRATLSD
jgi:sugar phosphate isomerase/epimerase